MPIAQRDPIRRVLAVFAAAIAAVALAGAPAPAAEPKGPSPTIPQEKDPARHQEFLAIAKAGGVDLLFLGDSITDGWRGGGRAVWDKYFAPFHAANFGIGGDRTEHVLWRLRNGELEGIQPKLVVLMIGTNNGDPAEDVAKGVQAILVEIHAHCPKTRILLVGIFPRGVDATDGQRLKNDQVNKIIAKYADGHNLIYLDIGAKFLAADKKTLPADIMPDHLHPNEKGYQIWADAIIDTVKAMMSDEPAKPDKKGKPAP